MVSKFILIFFGLHCQTQMFHFQKEKKKNRSGEPANTFEIGGEGGAAVTGPPQWCGGRDEVWGPIWLCHFLYGIIILRVINSGMLRSPTTAT